MNRILSVLKQLEEKCPMEFHEPLGNGEMDRVLPEELKTVYDITNGMEINVPGTVILPYERVGFQKGVYLVGYMNFGDPLYMLSNGTLIQVDHETGEEFLRWDSLYSYLEEELQNLRGGCE